MVHLAPLHLGPHHLAPHHLAPLHHQMIGIMSRAILTVHLMECHQNHQIKQVKDLQFKHAQIFAINTVKLNHVSNAILINALVQSRKIALVLINQLVKVMEVNGVHYHPLHHLMMAPPLHQQAAAAQQLVVISFVQHCVLMLMVLEIQNSVSAHQVINVGPHLKVNVIMDRLNQIALDNSFVH